jgi:hypothetical protein
MMRACAMPGAWQEFGGIYRWSESGLEEIEVMI